MSDHLKKADDVLARAQANSEPAETTRSAQAQPTASTKAREALGKRDATLSGAPKPRAKPKPDIAIAKGSADDNRATPLERTIAALAKLDFTFTYDLFRHQYHVGDHALQQRIGENVEHAILVLRTTIVSQFKFDPGPEKIKAAVYRLCINNSFNPVLDYLDCLEWDGKPRLDTCV